MSRFALAPSGFVQGERLFGLLSKPAKTADCAALNSEAGIPKYPLAADSAP